MAQRTYKIELKIDVPPEKHDVMRVAAREAAKHLLAMAMLVSEKRPPQIAVHSNDYFEGTEVIAMDDRDGET